MSVEVLFRVAAIGLMAAVIYSLMASTYWNGGMNPDLSFVFLRFWGWGWNFCCI